MKIAKYLFLTLFPVFTLVMGILTGFLLSYHLQPEQNINFRYVGQTIYARWTHQQLIDNPEFIEKYAEIDLKTSEYDQQQWVDYYDYLLRSIRFGRK